MANLSKWKKERMRYRAANAPPPRPKRGTPEWSKARNARKRARKGTREAYRAACLAGAR